MDSLFGIVLLWAAANGSPEATEAVKKVYPVGQVDSSATADESNPKKVALTPNYSSEL